VVFLTRAASLRVTNFSLEVGDDGSIKGSLSLATGYVLYPQWLRLAISLAREAKRAAVRVDKVWPSNDGNRQGAALEREVRYAAGTAVASVAAIDGLYGWLQSHATEKKERREGPPLKSPRYAQINELIRTSFKLNQSVSSRVRDHLKIMFGLRDQAVHPSSSVSSPIAHPRLGQAMNAALANFNAANAIGCVQSSVNIILTAFDLSKSDDLPIVNHIQQISPELKMIKRMADKL